MSLRILNTSLNVTFWSLDNRGENLVPFQGDMQYIHIPTFTQKNVEIKIYDDEDSLIKLHKLNSKSKYIFIFDAKDNEDVHVYEMKEGKPVFVKTITIIPSRIELRDCVKAVETACFDVQLDEDVIEPLGLAMEPYAEQHSAILPYEDLQAILIDLAKNSSGIGRPILPLFKAIISKKHEVADDVDLVEFSMLPLMKKALCSSSKS